MKNKILAIVIMLSTVVSCAPTAVPTDANRTHIKEVVKDSETAIVDVRVPSDFEKGTAHNAVNIPLAEIEAQADFFSNKKNIVVFCNSGRQSQMAIEKLHQLGIDNAYDGINWKNVKAIQEQK